MRRLLPLLLVGCAPSVSSVFDDYLKDKAELDPEWASGVGIHDFDDRLTRHDDASYAARRELVRRTLRRLIELRNGSIDARLFLSELEVDDYDFEHRDYRTVEPGLPVGAVSSAYDLLLKDFAPIELRVRNAAARLRAIPQVVGDARKTLARPPRIWTEAALEDLDGTLAFLDDFGKTAQDAGARDVADLAAAATEAKHSLQEYRIFLEKEILPRSDGDFAAGEKAYSFHLRHGLLVSMDADELLGLGQREFEKTIGMLAETAKRIDPSREWPAILEEMKKDHPKAEALLDTYRRETARARQYLIDRKVVGIPDGEKLEVIETPPFDRSSTPTAAYHAPGPLDAARVGHFYVTPPTKGAPPEQVEAELAAHNLYDIPGTVWHEAYPGHHLQFVYAKGVASKIRRLNESPLLSEGWGFYCEELAHETGYYRDPRERLMQLNWRLLRAARVTMDVSLHTGRMTFGEAVAFLVDRVRLNREQAIPSVRAFTQSPTYFSSYMLGMLEIVRMREKLRARLGDRFTLKDFHERLLGFGNVPPGLIEGELDRTWK